MVIKSGENLTTDPHWPAVRSCPFKTSHSSLKMLEMANDKTEPDSSRKSLLDVGQRQETRLRDDSNEDMINEPSFTADIVDLSTRKHQSREERFALIKSQLDAVYNQTRVVKLRQREASSKLGFSLRGGKLKANKDCFSGEIIVIVMFRPDW